MTIAITRRVKVHTGDKPAREVSPHGLAFIERVEGEPGTGKPALVAFRDPADVWTIGWGHTHGVHEGMTCTTNDAVRWLDYDLDDAEQAVSELVTVPLNGNQFDALVSWVFNVGEPAARTSTLIRLLNQGDYDAVPEQLARWNKITKGGRKVVSRGLVNRRAAEAALFTLPVVTVSPIEPPALQVGDLPPPLVPVPATASATPHPPPRAITHAAGGKTGVAALIAGAGGLIAEGYKQVQPTLDAMREITTGIGQGPAWLRVVGAGLVLVSIGTLAYSLWRRHRELRGH